MKKFLLLIVGLIALLTFQIKVVMPLVYDVIASDLFLEDSGDEANRMSDTNQMTDSAFNQCNDYIINDLHPDINFTFTKNPINAFSLGNFQYVLNADVDISPADGAVFTKRYVCRIKYLNKHDTTGLSNIENWSIEGLSGLDDI